MPRDVRARVKVRLYNNLAHEYVHAQTYRCTALNVAKKGLNALIYVAFFLCTGFSITPAPIRGTSRTL